MNVTTQKLQHFPLSKAFLCLDCSEVSDSGSICVSCGAAGTNLLPLARVLNRDFDPRVVAEVRP